jgi:hypothetical protein
MRISTAYVFAVVLRPKNNGNGKNIVETVYEPKIPNTVSQK